LPLRWTNLRQGRSAPPDVAALQKADQHDLFVLRQDIYAQAATQHLLTAQQREIAHIVGKHARLVGTHDGQGFRVAPDRRAGFALCQHHEVDAVIVLAQGCGICLQMS
jgi:DNA-binding LacI/PurR family transcriptional regulator